MEQKLASDISKFETGTSTIAFWNLAFKKIENHLLLKNNFVYILILIFIILIELNLMVPNFLKSQISKGEKH